MSDDALVPRLCHLVKWPNFNGFGFNLHAERGKAGQYIGKVDEGSPAEAAGLKPKDRIVEVNGANIGNENHQQVVMRIRAGGDETKLLVVDAETDDKYKDMKVVIRADLPEVLYSRADPPTGQSAGNGDAVDVAPEPDPEPEIMPSYNDVSESAPSDQMSYRPRFCHMRKWADFDGYGFNLHAEKDKPGQYIGKIDEGSPAEAAHLWEGDRIVEVNEENIEDCTHQQVIAMIKAGGSETRMLVVDKDVDAYYKSHNIRVHNDMPQIDRYVTPFTSGREGTEAEEQQQEEAVEEKVEAEQYAEAGPEEAQPEDDQAADQQFAEPVQDKEEKQEARAESGSLDTVQEMLQAAVITVRASATPEQEDAPASQKPMNGQQTAISKPAPVREPAPTSKAAVSNGDPMAMSAKELRERLAAKKRNDPRNQKMDFRTKHQLFEKM